MTWGGGYLIGLVLVCIIAFLYYSTKKPKVKPRKFNLENHTYLNQPLIINGEAFRVYDFDMQGTYVIVMRDSDGQKFKINKLTS